uniref:Uncharacterized protein YOR021C n=1 Tax=Lygus hesperus TaxID=30085 RepID=A0A0A9Y6J7_LYGHE
MPHTAHNFPYFVIEHNETEFSKGGWCYLEYVNILQILTPVRVLITNMPLEHQGQLPKEFRQCMCVTQHSILDFLGPTVELGRFSTQETLLYSALQAVETTQAVCFLDEVGTQVLTPQDIANFTFIIVGGILGDHPPKDVGKYIRESPYITVRNLGSYQMSTDTAVLACATVLRYQTPFHLLRTVDNYEAFAADVTADDGTIPCLCTSQSNTRTNSYAESTVIRMRYLTLHQPKLADPITLRGELSPTIA